jgi:hypothetical protein
MRSLAVVLGLFVAAAALVAAPTTEVRADAPIAAARREARGSRDVRRPAPVAAPRAGTEEEADEYARRESESPEVQNFAGGEIVFLLVVVALVLLIIVLAKQI